jgi:hypothetical protein
MGKKKPKKLWATQPYYPVDVSGASIPLHLIFDALPDAIYRATGMYLIPAGRTACQ